MCVMGVCVYCVDKKKRVVGNGFTWQASSTDCSENFRAWPLYTVNISGAEIHTEHVIPGQNS